MKAGRLPFIKVGHSVRFKPEDIARIRDQGYTKVGA
jgi:hypothetical protein